jgi:hypothetical protein
MICKLPVCLEISNEEVSKEVIDPKAGGKSKYYLLQWNHPRLVAFKRGGVSLV